jgi:hypothetical protein
MRGTSGSSVPPRLRGPGNSLLPRNREHTIVSLERTIAAGTAAVDVIKAGADVHRRRRRGDALEHDAEVRHAAI